VGQRRWQAYQSGPALASAKRGRLGFPWIFGGTVAAVDAARLDAQDEIVMRTPRRDGSWSSRPIWVVVVDGEAYVRSYLGVRGAWYRRVRVDRRAEITVERETVPVGLEPVGDQGLEGRISDAYRAKYGRASPAPTQAMVAGEAVDTTMRLTFDGD
jgi:hypothetical protein